MTVKYNNIALLHAYNKHKVNKSRIERGLAKGIHKAFNDYKYNSIVIFTNDNLVICTDKDYNLKNAFEPMKNYINRISKHCKEIILN